MNSHTGKLEWEHATFHELLRRGWLIDHMDGNHGGDYPRSEEFVDNGVPYIAANSLQDGHVNLRLARFLSAERASRLRKGFARDGDVLFAHNATVGPVALLKTTMPLVILGTSLTYFRCNSTFLLPEFLKSFLESELFVSQYQRLMGQSTRNQVPITAQRKFKCIVPPLSVQTGIAVISSTWDRGIRQLSDLIAAKIRFKQGLMQQLLTGKRRFPEYKDDWEHIRVGDIASELSERNNGDDSIPVLSCTKYNGLVDSLAYFGKRVFSDDTSNYKVVRKGDFAYATNHIEEGSIGLLGHADAGLVSPMYTVFRTNGRLVPEFLFRLLKTETYRQVFESYTSASVNRRGSLRWKQFATIPLKLPSLAEQNRIDDGLAVFDREIEFLRRELDALKKQKRGLMQKLLTGKIRVGECR